MAFSQFIELPAELWLRIFRCCSKKDLLNTALASKQCRDEALPLAWASLQFSWHRLETLYDVKKFKNHLKYTKQLVFTDEGSSQDQGLEQGYKNYAFHNILRYCDPDKLSSLTFRTFIVAGGLQLASELLPAINILKLDYVSGERHHWDPLCSFRCLKVLILNHSDIVDDALKNIGDLLGLREIYVTDCVYLTGSCLHHINKIASCLTAFEFSEFYEIPENQYEFLSDFNGIETLILDETKVGDNVFMQLSGKCESITELDISFTKVTDLGMPAISTFVSLRNLNLLECEISDLGLQHICKLKNLEKLNLRGCKITDVGLFCISKMMNLASLEIGSNRVITDQGLAPIMSLPSLISLDIGGCHSLTNASLEMISKRLLQLEYIDVTCRNFTIDGLNHLLELPNLKDVEYDESEINDEEIDVFFTKLFSKFRSTKFCPPTYSLSKLHHVTS